MLVMNMKDALKCVGLFAVGLLTAIFLYPFLHELGHSMAALFFGAGISDFCLLPLPSVVCQTDLTSELNIIVIGFGGMLLPYLLTLFSPRKHFWLWYLWIVLSGICLLSFAISIIGVVLFELGNPIPNEDITQVMTYSGKYYILYLVVLCCLSAFRITQIIHTKPIRRCLEEFGI